MRLTNNFMLKERPTIKFKDIRNFMRLDHDNGLSTEDSFFSFN